MRKWKMMFSMAAMVCMPALAQTADAGLYVPTPQSIVDAMLDMGGVKAGDHVLDLGSGDGRIVRTAALRMGASGTGVDIDTRLVVMANEAARKEGISARA